MPKRTLGRGGSFGKKVVRILAIDYGTKRIGLAVSDPLGFTAQGLETILVQNKQKTLEAVAKVCKDYGVGEIVVGFPVNMNGSLGPKARETSEWVEKLQTELNIPVKTWDERLTSMQADRLMIEEGLSRQKQKQQSDRLAATLILQAYLESQRSRKIE